MRTRSVPDSGARQSIGRDIADGIAYVRSQTWLWATLAALTLSLLFFVGPVYVLMPYVVKNSLHGGAEGLGLVFAAGGVGAIVAALLRGQLGAPRRPLTVVYVAWAGTAFSLVGYAVVRFGVAGDDRELLLGRLPDDGRHRVDDRPPAVGAGTDDRPRVEPRLGALGSRLAPISYALTGPIADAAGSQG